MKALMIGAAALLGMAAAGATEIVYTPVNPSFGGNPLNGPVLLNNANAQNRFTDPALASALAGRTGLSPLDLFNQQLQSAILSRIANAVTGNIVDTSGNLKPGVFETSGFVITIVDLGGSLLQITTTDKTTGASTTFQVSTAP
ncbi:MAG TPA: curli assembly protein CsgF [Burkholderiales bacterium]|nr:curli assembly protein CsgF [Burkholderiales bacterium]